MPKLQSSPFQKHHFIFSLACGSFFCKPRVCGEKSVSACASAVCLGSPPRMRGKGPIKDRPGARPRITPAYAGKSRLLRAQNWATGDHPRVCGEKIAAGFSIFLAQGSPPRMRGKVLVEQLRQHGVGITPAYAGKSLHSRGRRLRVRDHPRVCGEKDVTTPTGDDGKGSPPRMRGKAIPPRPYPCVSRITPAYAGKRPDGDKLPAERQDHPRVCGEKSALPILLRYHRGSPPRMRGKGRSVY